MTVIPQVEHSLQSPDIAGQLATLEETILGLARSVEALVPEKFTRERWRKHRTSPASWDALYHAYLTADDREEATLAVLSLRAMLADFAGKLHAEFAVMDAVGKPLGSLKLAKVRSQDIQVERTGPPRGRTLPRKPAVTQLPPLNYEDAP